MACQFLGESSAASFQDSKYIVIPYPYDVTASWEPGARNGPARILEASVQLELFDEEVGLEPYEVGIYTLPPAEPPIPPERAKAEVKEMVAGVLRAGKFPLLIGGDHSVTIGAVEAVASHHEGLSILQLDAHTDLRDEYQGTPLSHACVMRRLWDKCQVIQAGIRSCSKEEWDFLKEQGRLPFLASDLLANFADGLKEIVKAITGPKLYITLDIDFLDPSIMPATGTPEPGGMLWHHLMAILRACIQRFEVVGFDLVEFSPIAGLHFPQFTAAKIIYKFIAYMEALGYRPSRA